MSNPDKYATAVVIDRRDLCDDLWVVRLRTDCELPFRPGQYATLGLELNGKVVERPYSIVSAPEETDVEIFIELVPEGALTSHLYRLGTGDEILVRRKTKGLFLRNTPVDGQAHLFVATVTGIAPFVSFLRRLAARWRAGEWSTEQRITLLQGASRSYEFGYLDEMRAMAAEVPWFEYVPTVSRPWEDPEWRGETGRVEDVLRKYADAAGIAPGSGAVYLCGHPGMIATGRAIMRRRGLNDDSEIFEEQYWPDTKAAS
ncbi:MAG: ferredoxin--NADP reductase [Chloroflexi bacterium]|nr:MAG: ferredoxin--NADP reductase [Chloroflexota bacterium]